jgi:2-dehydro-3-deoxygluconokinase
MQPDIITLGEPMLEFNASDEGTLAEVEHFSVGWGGDTSNFAVAASRMGGKVGYLTRLGDDEFGESFLRLWNSEGIDVRYVTRDPEAFTGIYFISRKGRRHFFTYYRKNSAASRMTPDDLPLDYIRGARVLHVSGISQAISASACDTVFAAMGAAKAAGGKITYDPNLRLKLWPIERARAIIHQSMVLADVALPSYEDAVALTALKDPEDIVKFYLNMGPQVVILKLGGEGALLAEKTDVGRSAPRIKKFPAYKVDSVDMAGAGDTFDGAFVVTWFEGLPLERCVQFANAAGALTTTGLGAVRPIPSRQQVEALVSV